jgi:ABC-type lipoprotein export system ATPase subunit
MKIKRGEFVCVVGDVGSGKSSLLSSLLADLLFVSPEILNEYGGVKGMDTQLSDKETLTKFQEDLIKASLA